jgi:nitrite reductase/ring-hydroxylating ferredoxin subunit
MTFDVRTGALTCTPRLCGDQRVYPVEVVAGEVWVEVE